MPYRRSYRKNKSNSKKRPSRRSRRVRGKRRMKMPRTMSVMSPQNSVIVSFSDIEDKSQTNDFLIFNRKTKLDDFQKVDLWCKIFSQYRIIRSTIKYIPVTTNFNAPSFQDSTSGESSDVVTKTGAPRLFIRDNRTGDTSLPSNVDTLYLEKWKVKSMKHGENRLVSFKPNTLALATESVGDTVTSAIQYNKWYSTVDTDVYYQNGIQAVVANASASFPYEYKILRTIIVQFRNIDYDLN